MKRIKISREAKCAQGKFCFPLNSKIEAKQKWVDEHDLFTDADGKVFTLVDTIEKIYFMDAITGSLYQFGNCLTSSTLKAESLKRNQAAAGTILMNKKTDLVVDEIEALQLSKLDRATPFLIAGVSRSQFSIARHYGGYAIRYSCTGQ